MGSYDEVADRIGAFHRAGIAVFMLQFPALRSRDAPLRPRGRAARPRAGARRTKLKPAVYRALIDLVETTEREVADLHPADKIDIQSFIWVVGKYTADDEAALKRI